MDRGMIYTRRMAKIGERLGISWQTALLAFDSPDAAGYPDAYSVRIRKERHARQFMRIWILVGVVVLVPVTI